MKKIMLIFALLCCMVLPCFAAAGDMTVTSTSAQPGDVVYLTVTLNKKVVGDTVGIVCSYDEAVLVPVPASSSWAAKSVLEDFDKKGAGVWAGSNAVDLKGTLCIVAFRVLPDANLTQTTVTCSVTVKQESNVVGAYTAQAVISGQAASECEHEYGNWKSTSSVSHSYSCLKCGVTGSATHVWSEDVNRYTCKLCGYTRADDRPGGGSEVTRPTSPTDPTEKNPEISTKPVEKPTSPSQPEKPTISGTIVEKPTRPQETEPATKPSSDDHDHSHEATQPYKDYNGTEPPTDEHGHSVEEHEKAPVAVPVQPQEEDTDDHAGHQHTEDRSSIGSIIGIVCFVALLIGGAVYFVKKKH